MSLTKCKECGHEISDQAQSCPNCGAPQQKPKSKGIGCGSAIVLVLLVGWIASQFSTPDVNRSSTSSSSTTSSGPSGSTYTAPSLPSGPLLEVQSWRCEKEHGYVFVRGEVKNLTTDSLKNVLAVGEFRMKSGELVKSETALLEYNPILPGQTSPFRAGGTDNPQIKSCGVTFKYLMGGTIDSTEKPKKTRK